MYKVTFVLVSLLVFAGCSLQRSTPMPQPMGARLVGVSKGAVLAMLQERSASIHTFKGLAQTTISYRGQQDVVRNAVVYAKPGQLRWESFPLAQAVTLNLLVANGSEVLFVDAVERKAVRGNAEASFIKKALGISTSLNELASCLSGTMWSGFFADAVGINTLEVYSDSASNRLEVFTPDFSHYWVWDRPKEQLVKYERRSADGDLWYRLDYFDYIERSGQPVPTRILVTLVPEEVKVHLAYTTITVNSSVNPQVFQVALPADFSVEQQ